MTETGINRLLMWILIAAIQSGGLLAEEPVVISEDVLRLVDVHARYHPVPLASGTDGFNILVELEKLKVIEPSRSDDQELYDTYRKVFSDRQPFPTGPHGEQLRKLFDDNARGLTLMEQLAKSTGVRFPSILDAPGQGLHHFFWIRQVQAAWYRSQRQFDSAARILVEHLRIAEMLQDSDGGLIQWSLGSNLESFTLEMIARLSSDPEVPNEIIQSLQERVIQCRQRSIKSLAQCLRRDFFELNLPLYAGMPANATLSQAVEATVAQFRPEPPKFWVDLSLTMRKWQVLALLSKHPDPYDRNQTIQLASQRVAHLIRIIEASESPDEDFNDEEILRAGSLWPESLALDLLSLLPMLLGRPQWETWDAFWKDFLTALETSPQLSEIPNAFGKYLITIQIDFTEPESLLGITMRKRSRIEATIAAMAINRFERVHQRLPRSLQEVVDAKLLAELPRDPIDHQPLRYDPQRRLLWSIGLNGQDDGGVPHVNSGAAFLSMMRKAIPKQASEKLPALPETPARPIPQGDDLVYSLDGGQIYNLIP